MKATVVTLGVFDGVHLGHQFIFHQVLKRVKKISGTGVVYTFDPHPVKVLVPSSCPLMINTLPQKLELIEAQGMNKIIIQKFTKSFAQQTPEKFFWETLVRQLHAREIFVGYDFTFGVHRSGTLSLLETLAREANIRVHVIPPYLCKETLVSSTQVRHLLSRGDLEHANTLLGRPYFMEGKVIQGRGIGNRELGTPTANLQSTNDLILPNGVYVTQTRVGKKRSPSVTNIGFNPTFSAKSVSIETHLLHFRQPLVGKNIRVEFLQKIRDEIRFSSAKDLAAQIQMDIQIAEKYLKHHA